MAPSNPWPETGQCVMVRHRPAFVRNVIASQGRNDGRILHLIDLDYIDDYRHPSGDRVVWEREVGTHIFSDFEIPSPIHQRDSPEKFGAYIDALRWSSQGTYMLDGDTVSYRESPLLSPSFSAVQVEDYQLYPTFQALSMPRVNLLLADDVGLGKTIEAGLIVQELIRQRRIRRILIVCPASLQVQWKEEMAEKFSLDFTIIDSDYVLRTQRKLGVDSNPWRIHTRLIVSMDYLKQPDVLRRFHDASRQPETAASMLPWDLLIVDEAHNFTPSAAGMDSQRCQTLREIVHRFEHRLFLTATPHNGYTFAFSGLLELLDPVRFQQVRALTPEMTRHLSLVMIRRMKEDLNRNLAVPRFPNRRVEGLPIEIAGAEQRLYKAVREYRLDGIDKAGRAGARERVLAQFVLSLLTKRLLSSTYAFARTWWQHVAGFDLAGFDAAQVEESRRRAETPIEDDTEKDRREVDAVRLGGSWLGAHREILRVHLDRISQELIALGWSPERVAQGPIREARFPPDARFNCLIAWIGEHLAVSDERLIIFTEYKDTLDYLIARLAKAGYQHPTVETLFGGDSASHRAEVKAAFNDPTSPIRILVATDAASEGLNLQTACRYVLHQEIPWNPMRLEQRNGRVDRHGQWRDVTVYHFVSDQVEDLKFLDYVVAKVDQVRHDLGSVGRVFDEAVMDYFTRDRITPADLDIVVEETLTTGDERRDLEAATPEASPDYSSALVSYQDTVRRLNLTDDRLARLLEQAAKLEYAGPTVAGTLVTVGEGEYRLEQIPPSWQQLIEGTLLLHQDGMRGAQPRLIFSPERAMTEMNGHQVFAPGKRFRLLTLGHPVMQRALGAFVRQVWFPPDQARVRKWTIETMMMDRTVPVAVLVFQVSLRNRLGERFRTGLVEIPMALGLESHRLPKTSWEELEPTPRRPATEAEAMTWSRRLLLLWPPLIAAAHTERDRLIAKVQASSSEELAEMLTKQRAEEETLFNERMAALDRQKEPSALEELRVSLEAAAEKRRQRTFSEEINRQHEEEYQRQKAELEDAEWALRQRTHIDLLRIRLEQERERVLERVLPNRYALDDDGVEVIPVGVRVLIPAGGDA